MSTQKKFGSVILRLKNWRLMIQYFCNLKDSNLSLKNCHFDLKIMHEIEKFSKILISLFITSNHLSHHLSPQMNLPFTINFIVHFSICQLLLLYWIDESKEENGMQIMDIRRTNISMSIFRDWSTPKKSPLSKNSQVASKTKHTKDN